MTRFITRSAYVTRRGTYVPPTRIRNVGRPGKGPKILPTPRPGMLTMYGYSTSAPVRVRRAALSRAVAANSLPTVLKRLRLVATLTRGRSKSLSKLYLANRLAMKRKYSH